MEHPKSHEMHGAYGRLAAMAGLSFVAMYVLMYAMVDRLGNVHPSLNQAYMAALMTAPMVVIELLVMGMMYPKRSLRMAVLALSVILGVAAFTGIRQQFLIGDREFLRSMIPHHSGALLMCGKAPIRDPELKALCRSILEGQQAEIDQMDAMLARGR